MPDYDLGTARGRIELDASSLGRASAAFTGLGKVMIGTGALAVGAFAYAVKSAADFEKIMSAVGAVSNATTAEMAAMKEVALDLGSSTVYGADQVGRAMEQLAKAGLTVPEILDGATQATVTLAAAAGDELAGGIDQAAVVIANAMKTFGAGADEMDHFADVLVGAAASSTLSVDDIATSMTYAGPVAASLGLSIDDLSTALAILGDRGIRGSTAGTSLRGVFLSLATQTPKATKVMKELGIITEDGTNRFFDMNGALKPLPDVMQILGDATKNLSEQERIAAFNAIFQRRAMNAAMILAEQGAAGFDKYAAAIARIDASDVAAKKLDNLSGDVTLLKNAFETLMIRVGLPFQEMLRGWVQSVNDFVRELNQVDPELLAKIALFAAVGGAVLATIGTFLLGIGVVIKMYKNFVILVEAIKLVAGAMKLLTISFLTNPLFLFVAAVAAVVAAFVLAYKHSEEFRNRVDAAMRALEPVFSAVRRFVENFVEQFGNLIDVLREGDDVAQGVAEVIDNMFGNTGKLIGPIRSLVEAIQQMDDVAKAAFGYFRDTIMPILWDFADTVGRAIKEAVIWFIDEGIPAIQRFADAVMRQLGMAMDWLNKNVVPIFVEVGRLITASIDRIIRVLGFFAPYFEMIWKNVLIVLQTVWRLAKTVFENFVLVFQNFADNVIRLVTFAWAMVKQVIENGLRLIKGIISFFTGLISGDWAKAWGGIQQIFSAVWALIGDILQIAWGLIWQLLSNGLDLLISIWEVAWNTLVDVLDMVWDAIFAMMEGFLNFLKDMILNGLNLVKDTFLSVWNTIVRNFGPIIAMIWSAVTDTLGKVINFFRELGGKIVNAVGNMALTLYSKGVDIVMGFLNGIFGMAQSIWTWFTNLPRTLLSALGDVGSLLYNAGKALIQGFINGIKNMIGGVKDTLGGIADAAVGWKGPPSYDKVVLVDNGKLLMQGFMAGITSQLPALQKLLNQVAPSIRQQVAVDGVLGGMSTAAGSGSSGGTSVSVVLEFPNVTSSKEADDIARVVNDSDVLSKLRNAIKAGRR